jgi:hypothetical protein
MYFFFFAVFKTEIIFARPGNVRQDQKETNKAPAEKLFRH